MGARTTGEPNPVSSAFGAPVKPWCVWLSAAIGTALTAAFFYPGYLNGDSNWQYHQGRAGVYNDWHPVIMSWLWGQLSRVVAGSGGLFLLTTALFWIGLALVMRLFTRGMRAFVIAICCVGAVPPVFSMLSQIHKDVGMVTALLLGFAMLAHADRARTLWSLLIALVSLWYALGVRHNGAAAVLPFAFWASWLIARDHLPHTFHHYRSSTLARAMGGVVLLVALLGTSLLASRAILGDSGTHVAMQQFLMKYDLLGISVRSSHNFVPPELYPPKPFELAELESLYHPHTAYFAFWGSQDAQRFAAIHDRTAIDRLFGAWVEAVREEPGSYLRHRLVLFMAHLGIGADTPWRRLEFDVASYDYPGPTVFGMPQNRWMTERLRAGGGVTLDEVGAFFRPWPYLLLSLGCVVLAWSQHNVNRSEIAILGTSSLLHILPHFAIGVSAELRYMTWPMLVSLIQAVLLVSGFHAQDQRFSAQANSARPVTRDAKSIRRKSGTSWS